MTSLATNTPVKCRLVPGRPTPLLKAPLALRRVGSAILKVIAWLRTRDSWAPARGVREARS